MNITLLLNRDPASAYALSLLAPSLSAHQLRVFYTDKPNQGKPVSEALVDLAVFEKGQLAKFSALLSDLKAERLNQVNTDDFERFKSSAPDLVLSVRHMSILQSRVISLPKYGVINLHSGLLPSYQGVMATFWAMKNGEQEIGTTLHKIEDARIDTGAIIAQTKQVTRFDQSYFWNVLNIYKDGCAGLVDAVKRLEAAHTLRSSQQTGTAHYYSYPTSDDLDDFEPALFSRDDLDDVLS